MITPGQFFSLVDTQARMALKAEASKLYLSYLWWVLEPMLFVQVFYLVFEVLLRFGRENFLLFLMCGKIPFLWFSKSITMASTSIVQNRGLMNQVDLPKTLFPYASVQEALYKQWVVFLFLFIVVVSYGFPPSWLWLSLIPLILVQYVIILSCSLIAALLVSRIADVRILITMGLMFVLFTSGIFFDVQSITNEVHRDLLLTWNPMAFIFDCYRKVLMYGQPIDMMHLGKIAFVFCALLFAAHLVYIRLSRQIAKWVTQQ